MSAGKVKPLYLSHLIRDAFLSGRGLKVGDKLSEADQAAFMEYDPTEYVSYKRIYDALYPSETAPSPSDAAQDVLAERRRQIEAEGWTPEHDDEHTCGEIAAAAVCYAFTAVKSPHHINNLIWPWPSYWWKPTNKRRNLVKAGALILAEIERLDRAALSQEPAPGRKEDM